MLSPCSSTAQTEMTQRMTQRLESCGSAIRSLYLSHLKYPSFPFAYHPVSHLLRRVTLNCQCPIATVPLQLFAFRLNTIQHGSACPSYEIAKRSLEFLKVWRATIVLKAARITRSSNEQRKISLEAAKGMVDWIMLMEGITDERVRLNQSFASVWNDHVFRVNDTQFPSTRSFILEPKVLPSIPCEVNRAVHWEWFLRVDAYQRQMSCSNILFPIEEVQLDSVQEHPLDNESAMVFHGPIDGSSARSRVRWGSVTTKEHFRAILEYRWPLVKSLVNHQLILAGGACSSILTG